MVFGRLKMNDILLFKLVSVKDVWDQKEAIERLVFLHQEI